MVVGWFELIKRPFTRRQTDFVSVDVRRFSGSPKNYEMITSPQPPRPSNFPEKPEPVVISPPIDHDGLSPLPQPPRSPSSFYTNDYFGKETRLSSPSYGQEAQYMSPKLSFSTPRPPSAGMGFPRDRDSTDSRSFSHGQDSTVYSTVRSFSPQLNTTTRTFSPAQRANPARSYSPPSIDWDPASTHAKPSRRPDSWNRI